MEDITQELRENAALKVPVAETQGRIIEAMVECMWGPAAGRKNFTVWRRGWCGRRAAVVQT